LQIDSALAAEETHFIPLPAFAGIRKYQSPKQLMGAGKIKFEHLRKTKDLARRLEGETREIMPTCQLALFPQ
jgi:hypothetical protein